MDVQPVLDLIAAATPQRPFVLVGIGGHGGAGKSTLAREIPAAQVVGTDEFWDGAEFELSRLEREVMAPLLAGTEARFRGFDWANGRLAPELRSVRPEGVIVIEGVCALHRMLRDAYDVRIWVDAPYDVRLARGVARDGEAARRTWVEVWIPSEERYVERDDPLSCAQLVIDGGEADGANG